MKTAISLPDRIFASAEKMAKKLGVSRSQLYSTAIESYLASHDDATVTARLDAVYSVADSSLDARLSRLQGKSLPKEDW